MTKQELLEFRDLAEQGKVQFKERALNKGDISSEMSAFSNSKGGKLIIGINDKTGVLNPLSYKEVQETTDLLSTVAKDSVMPSIFIDIENIKVDGGVIIMAVVPEGRNKPYRDAKGIIWKKNGANKAKVMDNMVIKAMMEECGTFHGDEAAVPDATMDDLDETSIKKYLSYRFHDVFQREEIDAMDLDLAKAVSYILRGKTPEDLMRNLHFIRPDGQMTVAAMLLFGKYPQRFLPVMTAKCISFVGNSVGGTQFRDKLDDFDLEGNLQHQYDMIMKFFTRNLKSVQVSPDFNSVGELEISPIALSEFVMNALIHRSMCWSSPIRIFIFDDRIEIHSPGSLPGGLTIKDIKSGVSIPRNNFLFQNAIKMLSYTGVGSGIIRAFKLCPNAKFESDESKYEFIVTIPRKSNQAGNKSNQESNQVITKSNEVGNQVSIKSNQVSNQAAIKSNQASLSKKQIDLLNFCSVPRTAQEIMERLGVTNQSKNREHYIQSMLALDLLEMTDPEHPNSPGQKYRKKTNFRNQVNKESNQVGNEADIKSNQESNQVITKSNEVGNQVSIKSNEADIKSNQESNQVGNQVSIKSNQVSNQAAIKSNQASLSKKQIDLLNFCSVPRTAQEIMERLGITNQSKNRERYIQSMLALGLLEMTDPDHPKSPSQKYRGK